MAAGMRSLRGWLSTLTKKPRSRSDLRVVLWTILGASQAFWFAGLLSTGSEWRSQIGTYFLGVAAEATGALGLYSLLKPRYPEESDR